MEIRAFDQIGEPLLEQIGRLRVEAWQTETSQASAMGTWLDEYDRAARHWAIFNHGVLVAAARLSIHSRLAEVPEAESYAGLFTELVAGPIASLNRLVVHPSARRLGLSKKLDAIRLEAAEEAGCQSVILSTASGPKRVQQLVSMGFTRVGLGAPFQKPPLCYLPSPVVLLCRLPRSGQLVEMGAGDSSSHLD